MVGSEFVNLLPPPLLTLLSRRPKVSAILACVSLIAAAAWYAAFHYGTTVVPSDLRYTAEIASYDNFYDEERGTYGGEKRSVTEFSYAVAGQKDGIFLINNLFKVSTIVGEEIVTLKRQYGVDPRTGKHVQGFGDRDRSGYLFSPRHLRKGESFVYWHVNYDAPARMVYAGEEKLFGLPVYRFEADYDSAPIDQTENLRHLPGVGVTRGVRLEPNLHVWIEPVSGHLVQYKDETIAYYYDLQTKERLFPWNHFRNRYTLESVEHHVRIAQKTKNRVIFREMVIPGLLLALALLLIVFSLRKRIARSRCAGAAGLCILLCIGGVWIVRAVSTSPKPHVVEKLRVGAEKGLLAGAVWVAEQNGYFRDEGIDVEIEEFPSGRAAFESLLHDRRLDVATVAQTPVVFQSFQRNDFEIIAAMVSSTNDVKILARRDAGITEPEDLRGKKIGVTMHTTGHYFLEVFLSQHGLKPQDVTIMDSDAFELSPALLEGTLDAIATWEPHIYTAKTALGSNALLFESRGIFREDFYCAVNREVRREHPDRFRRFLLAIDRAETFIAKHPAEAQGIVARRLQLDPLIVESTWPDFSYTLFLDQAILLSLEQQARWMMSRGITDAPAAPNYLERIHFDALEYIRPATVTIIR